MIEMLSSGLPAILRIRGGRASAFAAAIVLGALAAACGQSTLRMDPGVPIEMRRGYCFSYPDYVQNGRERSRDDTLKQLSRYKETAPHVSAGKAWNIVSKVSGVLGAATFSVGLVGSSDGIPMNKGTATALMVSGAAVAALSVVPCFLSEGQYATAVELYNEKVVPRGGAADIDTDETDEDSDKDIYDDEGRKRPALEPSRVLMPE